MSWFKKKKEPSKIDVSTPIVITEEQKHELWLKKRGEYPTETQDLEAIQALVNAYDRKAQEVFDSYTYPNSPMYKIVQELAGHYTIKRRMSKPNIQSYQYYFDRGCYYMSYDFRPYYPWADQYKEPDPTPVIWYETVKNTEAPIQTRKTESYGRYGRHEREYYQTTGYADLAFNIFADAEAYLQRMVQAPEEREVGYNFPPLERVTMLLTGPENAS